MVRRATITTCLLLLTSSLALAAQEVALAPSTFALTNARIVVAAGNVIESGTVVVRDGRIAGVGAGVSVPAGALQIDLAGQTIYPGLIEVASSVGLGASARPAGFGFGGGGPPRARPSGGNGPPSALQPFRMASEAFAPEANELEALRRQGITTAGLAFPGGIFPGQTAAVSTGAGSARSQVLRTPVAMQMTLNTRSRAEGYPTTVMGTLAYIEQSFEDTRYGMRARAAFEQDPTSAPRPSYDPEHEALEAVVNGQMPVWFSVSSERNFSRVLRLAERIGLEDFVFLGAQEGYRVVELISRSGHAAIVSMDFPDPDRVTGRALDYHVAPVTGDDIGDQEADSAVALELRGNAAALQSAGITFALSSFGGSIGEFRSMVRATIEAGLNPDDALRAVTETPAQLLGLEGAIGTIEEGKLANLVVADGDLFAEGTKVLQVFVEGTRFDYSDAEEESEPPQRRGRRGGGNR